jgi:hypothetical protein
MTPQYPARWIVRDPADAEIGHVIPLGPIDPGKTDLICSNCLMDPPGEMLGWYLCPNAYMQMFFMINGKPWLILGRLIRAPCPVCNRTGDEGPGGGNIPRASDPEGDQEKYTDV